MTEDMTAEEVEEIESKKNPTQADVRRLAAALYKAWIETQQALDMMMEKHYVGVARASHIDTLKEFNVMLKSQNAKLSGEIAPAIVSENCFLKQFPE